MSRRIFLDIETLPPAECGHEACNGSSLFVESARIAEKPATLIGVIADSAPPQIMMSASPR